MAILTSYEGSNDDFNNLGTGGGYMGQGFQIPDNATVSHISIYGARGGAASGTFKIELLSGAINGTVIATTGTLTTTSALTAYAGGAQWNELALSSSVALTADTTYYLRLTALSGSTSDEVRWSVDTTSPSYSDGTAWYGTTEYTTRDFSFRISGTTEPGFTPYVIIS